MSYIHTIYYIYIYNILCLCYIKIYLYITYFPNKPTLHAVLLPTDTHAKFSSWYEATAVRIIFAPNLKHTKAIHLTRSSLMESLFQLTVQENTVHHSGEGLAVGTQSSWSHYIHSQEGEWTKHRARLWNLKVQAQWSASSSRALPSEQCHHQGLSVPTYEPREDIP